MSLLVNKKIAIASGKGGTGKTMFATNFSAFLNSRMRVLLADLDVEEPNCLLMIQGTQSRQLEAWKMIPEWKEDQCSFCDLCTNVCRFHAIARLGPQIMVFKELCHSCFACSELCPESVLPMKKEHIGMITHVEDVRLIVVEGKLKIGQEQAVPVIEQTLEYAASLEKDSDIQIFDCPPGNSCPLIASVRTSDYVILVTEPTPFGLHDFQITVEALRAAGKKMGVVINRDGIGNDEVREYCQTNRIPVLGSIKYDKRIAEQYAAGELIYNRIGHVSQAFIDITEALEKEFEENG